MWSSVIEIIPAPVLLGCASVALLAYAAAPEAGRRLAMKDTLPRCMTEAASPSAGRSSAGQTDKELGAMLLDYFADNLKGSDLGHGARGLAGILRGGQRLTPSSRNPAAICRCLIEAAVRDGEVRRDITIHLLSLRLVSESGVSDMAGHMARKRREGHCGTAVRS